MIFARCASKAIIHAFPARGVEVGAKHNSQALRQGNSKSMFTIAQEMKAYEPIHEN
jgi:hypothetical protein